MSRQTNLLAGLRFAGLRLTGTLLAGFLGACGGEGAISNLPSESEGPRLVEKLDIIRQADRQRVDVLWVVDNSCSMADDQDVLAENFVHFVDWFVEGRLDFHLGVVTTDPENDRGMLRRVESNRWIDLDTEDPVGVFREMVRVGTDGVQAESGVWSTWLALDIQRESTNAGFLRRNASVHTIVVSDEDDHTPDDVLELEDFLAWYGALREQPDRRTFSSIVATEGEFRAHRYLAATEAVGGSVMDIRAPDWGEVLDELGRRMTLPKTEFFLSSAPTDDGVAVEVIEDGEPLDLYEGLHWNYDPEINAVRFVSMYPAPGAEVRIAYLTLVEPEETGLNGG